MMGIFYSGGEDGVLAMFTPYRDELICKSQLFTEPIFAIDDSYLRNFFVIKTLESDIKKKKYPLIFSSSNRCVKICNTDLKSLNVVLTINNAHDGFVRCMKVRHTQGQNIMVTGGDDKCIKIWRIYWNNYNDQRD